MSVSNWVTNWKELTPQEGDLIEFNRGTYCHWAVYIGDGKDFVGKIMHFNPAGAEFVGVKRMAEFVPGKVTIDDLVKIQGKIKLLKKIHTTRNKLKYKLS